MPRVKVLKGVAHTIAASFTSSMNYANDDYAMGHILRLARQTGIHTLTINLLTGQGGPTELLQDPITSLPANYAKSFTHMVQSSGSDLSLVSSANLKLQYDLKLTRPSVLEGQLESPFTCQVSISSIQGRVFTATLNGWWFVQRMQLSKPVTYNQFSLWKRLTWLRRKAS